MHAEYLDSGSIILHELYHRDRSEAEILSPNGNLTLIGPNCVSSQPEYACIPLFRSRIKVMLYDGADNVFAKQCFILDDEIDVDDYYECVKTKSIHCELGSLTFKYVAFPFGINCRIQVMFSNDRQQASKKHDFVDVNGKVVVRYGNNYGNYSCEECVLFETQENESKRVEFDQGKMLQLSRCWVIVPAYSSLTLALNLSDFKAKQHIVNDSIEFLPQQGRMSSSFFVSGDIIIRVRVAWFSPKPMGRCKANRDYHFLPSQPLRGIPAIEIEEKDAEQGISTEEVEMMDIESSSDDESDDSSNLNPLDVKSLPIPDGSRAFEDFNPLEMKFDIKDVEGRLVIKDMWIGQHQSCWSLRNVFVNFKSEDADFSPVVCGSVIAEYSCYDYSSGYNKSYFRNILIRKTQNDPIRLGVDSSIPLSRSMVVVPSYLLLLLMLI
ncbi:60 kDa jasmonate-induced protein [Bienertia sinuspersici]